MLINIRTNLNVDKLRAVIRSYQNTPNFSYDNTYLIMNESTAKELSKKSGNRNYKSDLSVFDGIKIAYCPTLVFGEVEIK